MNDIDPRANPWTTPLLSVLHGKNALNPILCFLFFNQLSVHKKPFSPVPWQLCFYDNIAVECYWEAFGECMFIHIPFICINTNNFIELQKTS